MSHAQIFCLTGSTQANFLQVLILDVVEVREPRDVEVVSDPLEVLLQLHLRQQLQQPFCSFLTLHATAQSLEDKRRENAGCKSISADSKAVATFPETKSVQTGKPFFSVRKQKEPATSSAVIVYSSL